MNELFGMLESFLDRYLDDQVAVAEMKAELAANNPELYAKLLNDDEEDEDDEAGLRVDDQGVAHIQVSGVLTPKGPNAFERFFGLEGTGYNAISRALDSAQADPSVRQAVLHVNSGGGTIAGMESTHNRIRSFDKPIVAMNEGVMASAAYGIASAVGPGNIYATADSNQTGSIGVQATYVTFDRAGTGIKRHQFTSKNAPLKNASPETKAGAEAIQARIDATERIMHGQIATARGVTPEYVAQSYGRGDVLVARDPDASQPSALASRMIDGVRSSAPPPPDPQAFAKWRAEFVSRVSQTPGAKPGNPQSEETMHKTLEEFLASNPEARAFYDQQIKDARAEGEKNANTRAARVGAILASEAYATSAVIKAKAVECLEGKISLDRFNAVVDTADMLAEQARAAAAAGETADTGETAGQHGGLASLTVEAIEKMTGAQLRAIPREQIAAMKPEVLAAFEKAQAQAED